MLWMLTGLTVLIIMVLIRAVIGPTVLDRLISINAITGMISVIIILAAFIREEFEFVDIAIVFMLAGFAGGLWILRVLAPGVWELKLQSPDKDTRNKKQEGRDS